MGCNGMDFEHCGAKKYIDEQLGFIREKDLQYREEYADNFNKLSDKVNNIQTDVTLVKKDISTQSDQMQLVRNDISSLDTKIDSIYKILIQKANDEAKEAKEEVKENINDPKTPWGFFKILFNRQNFGYTFGVVILAIAVIWSKFESVTQTLIAWLQRK